jgi:hypothetical protein
MACRQQVEQHFTARAMAIGYERLYRTLIDARAADETLKWATDEKDYVVRGVSFAPAMHGNALR